MHRRFYAFLFAVVVSCALFAFSATTIRMTGPLLVVDDGVGTPDVLLAINSAAEVDSAVAPTGQSLVINPAPQAQAGAAVEPAELALNGVGEVDEDIDRYDAQAAPYFAAALRPPFAGEVRAVQRATTYSITIELHPGLRSARGQQRVRVVNTSGVALETIPLRLYPNAPFLGAALALQAVRAGAQPLSTTLSPGDATIASVMLLRPLQPGRAVQLDIDFQLRLPDRAGAAYVTFGWQNGVLNLPHAYLLVPPLASDGRFKLDPVVSYGDMVASEVAAYDVRIRAPRALTLLATGACSAAQSGDWAVHRCVAAPVRDFAIVASDRFEVIERSVASVHGGDVLLRVAFFSGADQAMARRALDWAASALDLYEQRFGPYPYASLTIFQSSMGSGGVEFPMLIGVTPPRGDETYFEWLVTHEVAHQWWYGLIGSDPLREPWLDESLTTYASLLAAEQMRGAQAAEMLRARFVRGRYERDVRKRDDAPVGRPSGAFSRAMYAPLIYGKGPLFFEDVRAQVGDGAFFAWLRAYADAYRHRTATAEVLLAAADQTGIGPVVRASHQKWIAQPRP